jgi:hypothetical protein
MDLVRDEIARVEKPAEFRRGQNIAVIPELDKTVDIDISKLTKEIDRFVYWVLANLSNLDKFHHVLKADFAEVGQTHE